MLGVMLGGGRRGPQSRAVSSAGRKHHGQRLQTEVSQPAAEPSARPGCRQVRPACRGRTGGGGWRRGLNVFIFVFVFKVVSIEIQVVY